MARLTVVHAWDAFWDATGYLSLHRLGTQDKQTEKQDAWVDAVTDLQEAGPLTVKQILAVTALMEATAERVKERDGE